MPKPKPGHSPPPPGTFATSPAANGELPGGGAVAVTSPLEYGPKRSGRSASRAPPPVGLENAPASPPGTRGRKKKKKAGGRGSSGCLSAAAAAAAAANSSAHSLKHQVSFSSSQWLAQFASSSSCFLLLLLHLFPCAKS